jgi:SAM-dependent methyltransferase
MTRPAVDARALPPADVLSSWMRTARPDDLQPRLLRLSDGRLVPLPVARWAGPVDAADESMLARVEGPVLDVGCGPGRLTAALHDRGVPVLGLELVPEVPALAYAVGAPVLVGDVFGTVPGSWRTVLLADGNVGIGGDPVRLLRRLRALLAPAGRIVCELHADADDAAEGPVRLEGLGVTSAWFRWALLGRSGLPAVAAAAGLSVDEAWDDGPRTFATLTPV